MRPGATAHVLVGLTACLWSGTVAADVIHLKNGNTLEGDIIQMGPREIVIEVPELGRMTLTRAEIASIEQDPEPVLDSADTHEVREYVTWQDASDRAVWLYQRRQFQAAEQLARRALEMAESFFGPTHSEVANAASLVGAILKDQGRYVQAEPFYALALRIWDGMEGSYEPTVATSLEALADVYVLQEKYAQAEPLLYRAVAIRENLLGPFDEALAPLLEQYADVLARLGRTELARQMAERAHDVRSP